MASDAGRSGTSGLGQIGQIALAVGDLENAVGFYRDVLGLPLLFQAPPNLAFFDCAGVRLMLEGRSPAPPPNDAFVIYYRVDEIRAAASLLQGRGIRFEAEPHLVARLPDHELWMAFFRDPHGHLLALMSEVRTERPECG